MIKIVLNEATFEPIAEFKKLAASLLTPTVKSITARQKGRILKLRTTYKVNSTAKIGQ